MKQLICFFVGHTPFRTDRLQGGLQRIEDGTGTGAAVAILEACKRCGNAWFRYPETPEPRPFGYERHDELLRGTLRAELAMHGYMTRCRLPRDPKDEPPPSTPR